LIIADKFLFFKGFILDFDYFSYFFAILGRIAHNVPAVYDVFAVAIKETVGFQQPQKCGRSVAWEWSVAE
jgi:hypothetical protein